MAGTTPVVMIWSRIGWSARGCAGFRLRHHLTSHRLDQRLIQRGEKRPFGHGQDDLRRRNRRWPNDFANVVLVERTDRRGRLVVSQGRSLMGVETGTQLESISNCVPVSSPRGRAYDGLHVSVRTGDEVPAPPAEVGALGTPRHFRSQRFLDWPETSWGWRQYKSRAGAGDLFDTGKSGVLQPIMPLDLPVKVRPWELTVYPRSHIRR